jgi:hypothetical protein
MLAILKVAGMTAVLLLVGAWLYWLGGRRRRSQVPAT